MSHCLSHIKADPKAWNIFHARHIENTDRLKNGYKRIAETKSSSISQL